MRLPSRCETEQAWGHECRALSFRISVSAFRPEPTVTAVVPVDRMSGSLDRLQKSLLGRVRERTGRIV